MFNSIEFTRTIQIVQLNSMYQQPYPPQCIPHIQLITYYDREIAIARLSMFIPNIRNNATPQQVELEVFIYARGDFFIYNMEVQKYCFLNDPRQMLTRNTLMTPDLTIKPPCPVVHEDLSKCISHCIVQLDTPSYANEFILKYQKKFEIFKNQNLLSQEEIERIILYSEKINEWKLSGMTLMDSEIDEIRKYFDWIYTKYNFEPALYGQLYHQNYEKKLQEIIDTQLISFGALIKIADFQQRISNWDKNELNFTKYYFEQYFQYFDTMFEQFDKYYPESHNNESFLKLKFEFAKLSIEADKLPTINEMAFF